MSLALDTNVLIRLLICDDANQAKAAADLIRVAYEQGIRAMVPQGVLLEAEWVLRSQYKRTRADIARAFSAILDTHELDVQQTVVFEEALKLFRDFDWANFADCLHVANAAQAGRTLFTFDKRAARLPGAARVPE